MEKIDLINEFIINQTQVNINNKEKKKDNKDRCNDHWKIPNIKSFKNLKIAKGFI